MRANNMTLQELRFLSIYLSKINPDNPETRLVRFTIDDFQAIMELGRLNMEYMRSVTNGLLCKVINVPNKHGGYSGFQLFKECTVSVNEMGEWYVEIDSHDKALPFLFEFKEKYFTYQLWNALRLKSSNQLRMYEILKQYERVGKRILSMEALKELLGIGETEYKAYKDFRVRVLNPCQQSLEENSDIKFIYEPYGHRTRGGKIHFLKFTIEKNESYVDQLSLDDFIDQQPRQTEVEQETGWPLNKYQERLLLFSEACDNTFTSAEMAIICDLILEKHSDIFHDDLACYDYILKKYHELNMQDERKKLKKEKIHDRFLYLKGIIEKE